MAEIRGAEVRDAHEMGADEMMDDEDRSFVRATVVGVGVGIVVMFAFIAIAASIVAGGAGWQFAVGAAVYAGVVTGGFFGGVVFAARHLMERERMAAAVTSTQVPVASPVGDDYAKAA